MIVAHLRFTVVIKRRDLCASRRAATAKLTASTRRMRKTLGFRLSERGEADFESSSGEDCAGASAVASRKDGHALRIFARPCSESRRWGREVTPKHTTDDA